MSKKIVDLYQLGQSIWYDNIERRLLMNGELKEMIDLGKIYGVTSNPSIFQKAIADTSDYDSTIQPMAWSGLQPEEIFYELAIEDIQHAADLFLSLYEDSKGKDGFVSLEVNPLIAKDTEATIAEVQELWKKVNRPNLMVKIPATIEGLPAIRQSIAAGININITLIFSVERYKNVIDSYLSGLEDRQKKGLPIDHIASVASFFVSRVDSKIDKILEDLSEKGVISPQMMGQLKGKAGLANSRLAYKVFENHFSGERFAKLRQAGANPQRPLWASTSTKNPEYSDILYVEGLVAPDTVNTLPPHTLQAFIDHGKPGIGFRSRESNPEVHLQKLKEIGIDMEVITDQLEEEGVEAFSRSYQSLLEEIEKRSKSFSDQLGELRDQVQVAVEWHKDNRTIERLFNYDPTLWSENPAETEEIENRLGWLDLPEKSMGEMQELDSFFNEFNKAGFRQAVLLGMGGSSLAPEVIAATHKAFGYSPQRGLELIILDSTNPDQINSVKQSLDYKSTLFIVSSKSGGTTETLSLMEFFWYSMQKKEGEKAGKHFIAITDPGSKLAQIAVERGFWRVFEGDPSVGGRFSALTKFGLVPARLLDIDLKNFLQQAAFARQTSGPDTPSYRNLGLWLGTIMSVAALNKKDKLTFITDAPVKSFGSWAEQLVAESSGKDGKGIVPIDNEPLFPLDYYANDRLFVYLEVTKQHQTRVDNLLKAGHPVLTFPFKDPNQLAKFFFIWEVAISIACSQLKVNAFNQPNVQDSKDRTKQKIEQIEIMGALDKGVPVYQDNKIQVYWQDQPKNFQPPGIKELVDFFLSECGAGDYFSINAFLPQVKEVELPLQKLRAKVAQRTNSATTLGFGPRYLHSTGQLHKGGPNKGFFLVITHKNKIDLQIPGKQLSFASLIEAQASGDFEALQNKERKVIHLHLTDLDSFEQTMNFF